jgi:hypothetical protein
MCQATRTLGFKRSFQALTLLTETCLARVPFDATAVLD